MSTTTAASLTASLVEPTDTPVSTVTVSSGIVVVLTSEEPTIDITQVVVTATAIATPTDASSSAVPSIIYSVDTVTVVFTDLSPAQTSLYYSELNSYLSGPPYLSLGSRLRAELPRSIFDLETTGGFAALSSEYGASFTDQPWYSHVEDVHTWVEAEFNTFLETVATQSIDVPSATGTAAVSATPGSNSLPGASHTNTTTTAIALGIAFGVFALLVFSGVFPFYLLRRRRSRQVALINDSTDISPNGNGIDMSPEKKDLNKAVRRSELPSDHIGVESRPELDGHATSGELQGEGDHVHELSDGRLSKNADR